MPTPNLSAIAAEVAEAQTALNRATAKKNSASAIYASALAQRPAGIDPTWLPDFTISGSNAVVRAWFDPNHFGNRL